MGVEAQRRLLENFCAVLQELLVVVLGKSCLVSQK
jgi:hypothetical protein